MPPVVMILSSEPQHLYSKCKQASAFQLHLKIQEFMKICKILVVASYNIKSRFRSGAVGIKVSYDKLED